MTLNFAVNACLQYACLSPHCIYRKYLSVLWLHHVAINITFYFPCFLALFIFHPNQHGCTSKPRPSAGRGLLVWPRLTRPFWIVEEWKGNVIYPGSGHLRRPGRNLYVHLSPINPPVNRIRRSEKLLFGTISIQCYRTRKKRPDTLTAGEAQFQILIQTIWSLLWWSQYLCVCSFETRNKRTFALLFTQMTRTQ